jgi:hypothetical protein
MRDLNLNSGDTKLFLTTGTDGASLVWEWEGASGALWLNNDQLKALTEWLEERALQFDIKVPE